MIEAVREQVALDRREVYVYRGHRREPIAA
jgi:hypothetical protein